MHRVEQPHVFLPHIDRVEILDRGEDFIERVMVLVTWRYVTASLLMMVSGFITTRWQAKRMPAVT